MRGQILDRDALVQPRRIDARRQHKLVAQFIGEDRTRGVDEIRTAPCVRHVADVRRGTLLRVYHFREVVPVVRPRGLVDKVSQQLEPAVTLAEADEDIHVARLVRRERVPLAAEPLRDMVEVIVERVLQFRLRHEVRLVAGHDADGRRGRVQVAKFHAARELVDARALGHAEHGCIRALAEVLRLGLHPRRIVGLAQHARQVSAVPESLDDPEVIPVTVLRRIVAFMTVGRRQHAVVILLRRIVLVLIRHAQPTQAAGEFQRLLHLRIDLRQQRPVAREVVVLPHDERELTLAVVLVPLAAFQIRVEGIRPSLLQDDERHPPVLAHEPGERFDEPLHKFRPTHAQHRHAGQRAVAHPRVVVVARTRLEPRIVAIDQHVSRVALHHVDQPLLRDIDLRLLQQLAPHRHLLRTDALELTRRVRHEFGRDLRGIVQRVDNDDVLRAARIHIQIVEQRGAHLAFGLCRLLRLRRDAVRDVVHHFAGIQRRHTGRRRLGQREDARLAVQVEEGRRCVDDRLGFADRAEAAMLPHRVQRHRPHGQRELSRQRRRTGVGETITYRRANLPCRAVGHGRNIQRPAARLPTHARNRQPILHQRLLQLDVGIRHQLIAQAHKRLHGEIALVRLDDAGLADQRFLVVIRRANDRPEFLLPCQPHQVTAGLRTQRQRLVGAKRGRLLFTALELHLRQRVTLTRSALETGHPQKLRIGRTEKDVILAAIPLLLLERRLPLAAVRGGLDRVGHRIVFAPDQRHAADVHHLGQRHHQFLLAVAVGVPRRRRIAIHGLPRVRIRGVGG